MRLLICLLTAGLLLPAVSCKDNSDNSGQNSSTAGTEAHPTVRDDSGFKTSHADSEPAAGTIPTGEAASASGTIMRGLVKRSGDGFSFTSCDGKTALPLADTEAGLFAMMFGETDNEAHELYVQMQAAIDGQTIVAQKVWRASHAAYNLGCEENLSGLVFLARGREPFWGLELRSNGEIALLVPTEDDSALREEIYRFTATDDEDGAQVFLGQHADNGSPCRLSLYMDECADVATMDWFGMRAEFSMEGRLYQGCAWPGEAGPEELKPGSVADGA